MRRIILKAKEERRLLRGHLWVYRNEIASPLEEFGDGDTVDVAAQNGRFIGRGFFQEEGGIAVRLLTQSERSIDAAFFAERVSFAGDLRARLYPGETVYRWMYGESDELPGLIADRYGKTICVQTSSRFYTDNAQSIADAFLAADGVEGVLFQRDAEAVLFGDVPDAIACESHGLSFAFQPDRAQKTGLFLDQRDNWAEAARFASGARVLDVHCYTGAWSLIAGKHGATEVLGIDSSQEAVDRATENARRNGLEAVCRFEKSDAQEALAKASNYDMVLLDPPALAKKRKQSSKALGLYRALNRDAMKAVKPGGILISSSCSQPVGRDDFLEMLKRASASAQRRVQVLALHGASADHPALLAMPETSYLKCAVLRVL